MQFIFLGPPGAGKGTQASILADRWHIPHISIGDILREAIAGKTSLGIRAQRYVEAGELVPDILVMSLVRERFGQLDIEAGWLLDGFPRTLPQAQALDELLTGIRQPYPTVVYFEVATQCLIGRMLSRGRQDDDEDTIRRRLEIYQEETAPLIDFYQRRRCLRTVDGNLSLRKVAEQLQVSLLQKQYSVIA